MQKVRLTMHVPQHLKLPTNKARCHDQGQGRTNGAALFLCQRLA